VLGGYDQSRFIQKNISFPIATNHSLGLTVSSVTIDSNGSTAASSGPFTAVVDSAMPYLWLPTELCDLFADQFGLEYDATYGYYFANESSRQNNRLARRNVTLTLAASSQSNEIVSRFRTKPSTYSCRIRFLTSHTITFRFEEQMTKTSLVELSYRKHT